jgi:hypothetical protein
MADEPELRSVTVDTVNGRLIRWLGWNDEFGWWMLEVRGPHRQGTPLQAWLKFETLNAAREKALLLGPISESDASEIE